MFKRFFCVLGFLFCFCLCIKPEMAYAATFDEGILTESGFQQIQAVAGTSVQLELPVLTTSVEWRSSAPAVASVGTDGKVSMIAPGTAIVYASSAKSSEVYQSWIFTVTESTGTGSLTLSTYTAAMQTGGTAVLTAKAQGDAVGTVTWASSDPSVVAVSNGKLTAVSNGSAMIYATSENGRYTASCVVYVLDSTLTLPVKTTNLPEGMTLYNYNKSAITGNIIWVTSDPNVAVVRRGFIEAVGKGTAVITAVTETGGAARCTVTVTDPESVTAAYLNPNNPTAGAAANLILIANPDFKNLNVSITNSAGTVVQTLTNSGLTPTTKEANGRSVNIWSIPVTFDTSGTYTVKCGNGSNVTYSFTTFVAPQASDEGNTAAATMEDSENTSSTTEESGNTDTSGSITEGSDHADGSDNTGDEVDTAPEIFEIVANTTPYATTAALNLRAGPDTSYEVLTLIPRNTLLEITEIIHNDTAEKYWGSVTYGNYSGYVSMNFVAEPIGELRTWYVSSELLNFVTLYEGFYSTVYYDVVNVPTIGYGQALFYGDTFYNYQTKEEAWAALCNSMNQVYGKLTSDYMLKKGIYLTQNQFDALVSFAYNYGQYSWTHYSFKLKTLLLENKYGCLIDSTELRYAFGKLSRSGGTFWLGLFRRRMNEWNLFVNNDYTHLNTSDLTGNLAFPPVADQNDPNKYGSDWTYTGNIG